MRPATCWWSSCASADVVATGDAERNGAADAVATPATMPPVASAVITIFLVVLAMGTPRPVVSSDTRAGVLVPSSVTTVSKPGMN